MFKNLGFFLEKRVNHSPMLKGAAAAMAVEAANAILQDTFGQDIAEYAQAAYLKDGALAIGCLSSTAAQEIRLQETTLILAINKKLGAPLIKKIHYLQ